MSQIWVERCKWPDLPHYGHPGWVLGEDDRGLWIELRVGDPVYRGEELLFHGKRGGVLVPPDPGWIAWFPESGEFDLYIDIVTGLRLTDTSVTMIDVDLDVMRLRTGEVKLLDEDEFAEHQVSLGYSQEMITQAEADADRVLGAVRSGDDPFDGVAAAEWLAGRDLA